ARKLFLSPNTVKFHISNIMRKLDVRRRTEIAFRASKNHLV
ncbi:MAG: response regulator transcription factor, partial [Anaerolineae bacterium]